ncbi:MAG: PDZ domain-containing protein [Pirellulales bacterium]
MKCHKLVWILLTVALPLGWIAPAAAVEPHSLQFVQNNADFDSPSFWKQVQEQFFEHKPSRYEKAHASVRAAFRDVVADASRATVAIYHEGQQVALGTIVDAEGFIVTKASELAGNIEVQINGGRKYPAEEVKRDAANDLALIKIEATGLPVIEWRDGDDPALGSWLITADSGPNPLAVGVASVAARKIRKERGLLGVRLEDSDGGPLIDEVIKESAAEVAGLAAGDVVTAVNDQQVDTREKMIRIVGAMAPGDKVRLKIVRDAKQLDLDAVLGSLSLSGERANRFAAMNHMGGPLSQRRMGFELALQHDTFLLPNQCGGPLCDLDGKAVGVNIARAGRVNSYAVPASVVKSLLADIAVVKLERTNGAMSVTEETESIK